MVSPISFDGSTGKPASTAALAYPRTRSLVRDLVSGRARCVLDRVDVRVALVLLRLRLAPRAEATRDGGVRGHVLVAIRAALLGRGRVRRGLHKHAVRDSPASRDCECQVAVTHSHRVHRRGHRECEEGGEGMGTAALTFFLAAGGLAAELGDGGVGSTTRRRTLFYLEPQPAELVALFEIFGPPAAAGTQVTTPTRVCLRGGHYSQHTVESQAHETCQTSPDSARAEVSSLCHLDTAVTRY
jgi:hypothetical protein